MNVLAFLSPSEIKDDQLVQSWVVLVDVLRATSTIITAFHHGVKSVRPVSNAQDARELAQTMRPQPLLGGEERGFRAEGFDFGNSPLEYTPEVISGQRLVFSTTNGTRTLLRIGRAQRVFLGAFLNAQALADFLEKQQPRQLIFVCAGLHGYFSLEDAISSGYIINKLKSAQLTNDGAVAASALAEKFSARGDALFREAFHGRYLLDNGFESDLRFCARKDVFEEIPEFVAETGEIVLAR